MCFTFNITPMRTFMPDCIEVWIDTIGGTNETLVKMLSGLASGAYNSVMQFLTVINYDIFIFEAASTIIIWYTSGNTDTKAHPRTEWNMKQYAPVSVKGYMLRSMKGHLWNLKPSQVTATDHLTHNWKHHSYQSKSYVPLPIHSALLQQFIFFCADYIVRNYRCDDIAWFEVTLMVSKLELRVSTNGSIFF